MFADSRWLLSICLLLFMCYSWQIRWMHYFAQEKNRLLSLPLSVSVSFKHGLTPNVTLGSKHHPWPVPAGECQTVCCKALHPLKALHFKQNQPGWLFLYTACDMNATSSKLFTSLITFCFSFFQQELKCDLTLAVITWILSAHLPLFPISSQGCFTEKRPATLWLYHSPLAVTGKGLDFSQLAP